MEIDLHLCPALIVDVVQRTSSSHRLQSKKYGCKAAAGNLLLLNTMRSLCASCGTSCPHMFETSNHAFGVEPVKFSLEGRVQAAVLHGESDNKRDILLGRRASGPEKGDLLTSQFSSLHFMQNFNDI